MALKKQSNHLAIDLLIVLASIALAIIFIKTGFITGLLASISDLKYLISFIAGLFFSSIFTVAPSIVIISEVAKFNSIIITSLLGGLGALIGDLIIFQFIKGRVAADIAFLIKQTHSEKIFHIFKRRMFRWLLPFIGALIIASPLPDELGITLMGLSKTKTSLFIILSFLLNFTGILIIAAIARSAF